MRRALTVLMFVGLTGTLVAQVPIAQPDVILTGNWQLVSVAGTDPRGSGASVGWGPDFIAFHEDQKLSVLTGTVGRLVTKSYRLDGVDVTVIPEFCDDYDLITKAMWKGKVLVITETASYHPCPASDINPRYFNPPRPQKVQYAYVRSVMTVAIPFADALTVELVSKPDAGEKEVTSLRTYQRKPRR